MKRTFPLNPFSETCLEFLKCFDLTPRASLAFLHLLGQAFASLPYENATKIIKKRTGSAPPGPQGSRALRGTKQEYANCLRFPDEVFRDYQRLGAGGTCFSLTYFLQALVTHAGFVAYPVMAHRSYGNNTHCALVVLCDEKRYLLDPGYLVSVPLELRENDSTIFQQPFQILRLEGNLGSYKVITKEMGGQDKLRYIFEDKPISWDDFFDFWMGSFDWPGLSQTVITRVTGGQHVYARGNYVRIASAQGVEKKKLNDMSVSERKLLLGMDVLIF